MLRQSLHPDPSCRSTLAWLQSARTEVGLLPLSSDTGGYCKARRHLPETLLRKVGMRVGEVLSNQAGEGNLWFGRRVLAADGSAFSMPDTEWNQAKYPQPTSQKPGCGFPVARFVAVICLATGAFLDAALGTWNAHDMALFYYVRSCFRRGDIFLADRGFSSYAEMALFLERDIDSVVRLHQRRRTDFRRGRVLGVDDHIEVWIVPDALPRDCGRRISPDCRRHFKSGNCVTGWTSRDTAQTR